MDNLSMKGRVVTITPTTTTTGGFSFRDLLLEVVKQVQEKTYTDTFQFTITGKCLESVDDDIVGCDAEVFFNLRSREYNGKYYTSLSGWKVSYTKPVNINNASNLPNNDFLNQPALANNGQDDLPF